MKIRLTTTQKKEALDNFLISAGISKKYFIKTDEIKGKTFALASISNEYGGINIHSNFMEYEAFNMFLFGYLAGKENKYND